MNKKKNKSTKVINILIAVLIAVFAFLFIFGIIVELLGGHCPGFMGGQGSCVENYALFPFLMIGLPILVLLLLGLTLKKYAVTDTIAPSKAKKRK